jgi:hypothetical protein
MITHLPPLFTILGVLFAALIVGWLVGGALAVWAILHMDSGPGWYGALPIPGGIIAGVVAAYFSYKLT